MKKALFLLLCLSLLFMTSCNRHSMPDDFNISFQFGTTDADLITIDTYNQLITRGSDQKIRLAFKMSDKDKKDIYDVLTEDLIHGYKGEYRGTTMDGGVNQRFSIKFTAHKRTRIISGDSTTKYYKKRDASSLVNFEEYMINYVKQLKEYKQILAQL